MDRIVPVAAEAAGTQTNLTISSSEPIAAPRQPRACWQGSDCLGIDAASIVAGGAAGKLAGSALAGWGLKAGSASLATRVGVGVSTGAVSGGILGYIGGEEAVRAAQNYEGRAVVGISPHDTIRRIYNPVTGEIYEDIAYTVLPNQRTLDERQRREWLKNPPTLFPAQQRGFPTTMPSHSHQDVLNMLRRAATQPSSSK